MAKSRLCSIPKCGKPHDARGWCKKHYRRWQHNGDPMIVQRCRTRDEICSVNGCDKPRRKREWCDMHYSRWKRRGDPLSAPATSDEAVDFFRNVVLNYDGNDCLTWPFSTDRRGSAKLRGKVAARLVCEHFNGPPPTPKHHAAHSCGKGHEACVAKRHLSWKTPAQNKADELLHGTRNRGERHGLSKLTASQVKEIRLLKGTQKTKDIAALFRVSEGTVRGIYNNRVWQSV